MNRLRWLALSTLGGAVALHFLLSAEQRTEVRSRLASATLTMMRYGRTRPPGPAPEMPEAGVQHPLGRKL